MSHHVGDDGSYTFSDWDGESLRFRQEENSVGGTFLTITYSGAGPVIPSGIDSVARMALAMLERSSGVYSKEMATAVRQLRRAVEAQERGRRFKLNEVVEVFDEMCGRNTWIRGVVTEYGLNGYSVQPDDSGISLYYLEDKVRKMEE